MSKKLVASLIGWLILAFMMTSSVWAAANKDKTPVRKEIQAPLTAQSMLEMIKQKHMAGQFLSYEEKLRALDAAHRAEAPTSVYDAVSGVISESPFFAPIGLSPSSANDYDSTGPTWYGINSNHRNPRQIAFVPSNRNVGLGYAHSPTSAILARNFKGSLWKNSSKTGGNFLPDILMNQDAAGRSGFGGFTYLPKTGRLVIYGHHANAPRGTFFGAELTAGLFDWGTDSHVPDSFPGDTDRGIWPTAAGGLLIDPASEDYDGDGDITDDTLEVIHFFMNEGNTAGNTVDHYMYARAIDSAGVWIFPGFNTVNYSNTSVVDTAVNISPTVVASKKSQRVALMWTAEKYCGYDPVNCSDVFYLESMNGGEDWRAAGFNFTSFTATNVTNFDSSSGVNAIGDHMGVYDNNDSLVIAWVQTETYEIATGSESYDADIYVWTKEWGKRKAVSGNFNLTGTMLPQAGFRKSVNFPHIAVHTGIGTPARDNYLYMTYTQYGGSDAASMADTNIEGILNGEVYLKASTNRGKTWSAAYNVTNSKTPACSITVANVGNCASAMFSTCAEKANDTIHISYLDDQYSGIWTGGAAGDDNTSAQATNNMWIYMKYPAISPPPVPSAAVTPTSFIQNPGSVLTDTLFVQNIGNANLVVSSITHSQPWLDILNDSAGFTIVEGDPDKVIAFTVDDAGYVDGVYYDTMVVHSNAAAADSALKVPVFMIVDNGVAFVSPQWKTMDNGVVKIDVSNVSNIGNQKATAGFYRLTGGGTNVDTTNNLFDASKSIDVIGLDAKKYVARWVFNQNFMQPLDTVILKDTTLASALPKKPGSKVKIPAGAYKYAHVRYTAFYPGMNDIEWPGPWWGITVREEWWLPKTPSPVWDPKFLLWCQTIYFRQLPPSWWVTGPAFDTNSAIVYINKAMDWDVYTFDGSRNWAWSNKTIGAAWQEGIKDTLPLDEPPPNGHFGFVAYLDSLDNPSPYAVHIVSNPSYIYPNSGYVDAELYDITADTASDFPTLLKPFTKVDTAGFKYVPLNTLAKDTLPTDLNIVMTDLRLAPPYPDSITVYNLLGVIGDTAQDPNKGCDSLANAYNAIRAALGIGTFSLLDSLLNCKVSNCIAKPGDANASGNYTLGDVISIVNYVFNKPGCSPQPLCWLSNLLCRGDWNASGNVTLSDVIQAVNFVFNKPGGPWNAQPIGVCCLP